MSNFRIFETPQFIEDLKEDCGGLQGSIYAKLCTYVYPQLRVHPYFGPNIKKLKDNVPETWRYRVGNYRFFYQIDDRKKVVIMISVSHRKDAY